jgi:hypothetical protein
LALGEQDDEIRAPAVRVVDGWLQEVSRIHQQTARELRKMSSLLVARRRFLSGLASVAVCAPAVVRASSLMGISARFCGSAGVAPPWASTREALAWLQNEMERRFAETLFGPESLSAEAETAVTAWSPVVADAKITALWELRTRFGPRGSPPKPLEEMPAEVRAGLFSMLGGLPNVGSEARGARFSGSVARKSVLRSI